MKKFELRQYQQENIEQIKEAFQQYKRVCYVLPCGGGKTKISTNVVKEFSEQPGKILFLVDRDVLVEQTSETFLSHDLYHGFIKSGYPEDRSQKIQIASTQTLSKRQWWKYEKFSLLIVDECHEVGFHQATQKFREFHPNTKELGLTATPYRLSKKEGLADIYEMIVSGPVPKYLKDRGYLVERTRYFSLPEADLKSVKTSGGDFVSSDLAVVCDTPELIQKAHSEYLDKGNNERFLAFCVNKQHAYDVAGYFNSKGIKTVSITDETSKDDRKSIYEMFDLGLIKGIASVGVLSKGFDSPKAVVGLLLRPTKSRALHFQQIGRLERSAPGKTEAIILDQAGNTYRHGKSEWIEEYSIVPSKQSNFEGEAPTKVCPECHEIHHLTVKVCDCGYEFPQKKKVQQKGKLEEIGDKKHKPKTTIPDYARDLPLFSKKPNSVEASKIDKLNNWLAGGMARNEASVHFLDLGPTMTELHQAAKILGFKPGWAFKMKGYADRKRASKLAS